MAVVSLQKGQRVSLNKGKSLHRILVGLGWDPIRPGSNSLFGSLFRSSGTSIDVDSSVICIDKNGRENNTVYFGRLSAYNNAIIHHGDNLTGDGDGDDEQIEIDLSRIPENITRLSVIINIYEASNRGQDFSQIKNCFVHVDDMSTGKELVHYDIGGDFKGKTGIFVGDIYRHNGGEWKFAALGDGVQVRNISEMVRMKCN